MTPINRAANGLVNPYTGLPDPDGVQKDQTAEARRQENMHDASVPQLTVSQTLEVGSPGLTRVTVTDASKGHAAESVTMVGTAALPEAKNTPLVHADGYDGENQRWREEAAARDAAIAANDALLSVAPTLTFQPPADPVKV